MKPRAALQGTFAIGARVMLRDSHSDEVGEVAGFEKDKNYG